MVSASEPSIRFSEHESEELGGYQPLNRASLYALLLGFASVLAPFHLAFCLLPMLGAISAVVGLQQLRRPEIRQSGHSLAVLGLCLSLLFSSWGIARESSRRQRLQASAMQFAENWFDLIRNGKLYEAHQLSLQEGSRVASGESLAKHYLPPDKSQSSSADSHPPGDHAGHSHEPHSPEMMEAMPPPHQQLAIFFDGAAAKQIRNLGPSCRFEYWSAGSIEKTSTTTTIVDLTYRFHGTTGDGPQDFLVRIALERVRDAASADWRVTELSVPTDF